MKATSLLFSLCLCLAAVVIGRAQQPAAAPNQQQDGTAEAKQQAADEAAARRRRGVELLRATGWDARHLDNRFDAARLQGETAQVLWQYDSKAAEELAQRAFAQALTHFRENKQPLSDYAARRAYQARSELCKKLIRLMRNHDKEQGAQFEEKFLTARRELHAEIMQGKQYELFSEAYLLGVGRSSPSWPEGFGGGYFNNDLLNNPQLWLSQARQVYSSGFPRDLLVYLWTAANLDRAATEQFVQWLLARIQEDELAGAAQLLAIAPFPFGEHGLFFISDGRGGMAADYFGAPRRPHSDPPALRRDELLIYRFIEVASLVITRTLAADLSEFPDGDLRLQAAAFLARWLEPRVEQFQPALAPGWRALLDLLNQRLTGEMQARTTQLLKTQTMLLERNAHLAPKRQIEPTDILKMLLTRAEKSLNRAERDFFYQEAAMYAAERQSDYEKAFDIADSISANTYREEVRAWLSFDAAKSALSAGRADAARHYAEKVTAIDLQTYLHCQLAKAALPKDRDRALRLLNEAELEARRADSSAARVRALLLVTSAFAAFDQQRASEALAEVVQAENKVSGFDLDQLKLVRRLEHPAGWPRVSEENAEGLGLRQTFAKVAQNDFEEALAQASALAHKPLRYAVVITLAQTLCEPKPKAPPTVVGKK